VSIINRQDIKYKHLIAFKGVDSEIDGIVGRCLITKCSNSRENEYELNTLISDTPFGQGSLLIIENEGYLVIDMEKQLNKTIYNRGTIRKAVTCWYNPSNLQTTPVSKGSIKTYGIIDRKSASVDSSSGVISVLVDMYDIILANTDSIDINYAVFYNGTMYKVTNSDNTKEGLLNLVAKYDSPYIVLPPHAYTITLNSNVQSIVQFANYQIIATCTIDGEIDTIPDIVYTSSDETIATVDENGLVVGTGVGSAIITASYYEGATYTLALTVNAKPTTPVIAYSSAWSNTTTLKTLSMSTFSAIKTINAVADSTLLISWTLDSLGASLLSAGKITITTKSNSSFQIKNVSQSATTTFHITVSDSNNGNKILDNQLFTLTAGI